MGDVKSLSEKANFGTISHPVVPPPELQLSSSEEYVSFDSRESVLNRIKDALADTKVNVVGVYGVGGVGKTTMVEKVGEQVKKDGLFYEVVMAVVSQDAKVVKIQGVLADRLNLKLEAELTEVGRADRLWNRLNNGKRNLVILVDIWKELNLKEIGIPITDGKKGCKVILTSRNQHVLKNMQVDKDFLIQALSEQEAWNLFKTKINVVDSHDPLHYIKKEVCRECRGRPIAILVVGAALKGKSMSAWEKARNILQSSIRHKVMDPVFFLALSFSIHYLESTDAKSCFWLCCLFPEDSQVPIEALARHCMARRLLGQKPDTSEEAKDIIRSVVDTLKTKCLLLDGKNDDFVKMHNFVRDVAIEISIETKEAYLVKHGVQEWPETGTYEKYSAISLRSETFHGLPDELVCPKLHTLMLECSSNNFLCECSTKIPDKFFRGTEKLVVLELNRVTVSPLPSSLEKLTELRMLCLNECKLGDIAILKDLKNKLEVLILRGSYIKALPLELGELTCLRLLDLGDCRELEVIPNGVISKLHRLEELHFPVSFYNWKGTTANEEISKVSVEELMSLTQLSTLDICIPFLRLLPEDLGFLNLSKFFIIVGSPKSSFGDYLKREEFPSTSVVLNEVNFENEGLIDISILERLLGKPKRPIERGGLYPSRSFNNLTDLVLLDCKLKYLFSPSCARRLLQLQRLIIRDCGTMEAVIGNLGNEEEKDEEIITNVISFSQLTTLELCGLPRLISFYPRIKKATATESHSFAPARSLFNEKVTFPRLENLELDGCESLRCIFQLSMARVLVNLQQLIIHDCLKMEAVVDGEEEIEDGHGRKSTDKTLFPHLSQLELRHLPELRWFCHFRYPLELPLLSQMVIEFCPKLNSFSLGSVSSSAHAQMALFNDKDLLVLALDRIEEIWDKQSPLVNQETESFGQLKNMTVRSCRKLTNLFPSTILPRLQNLQTLLVDGCPNVEFVVFKNEKDEEQVVDDSTLIIPQLTHLQILDMEKLKSFCSSTTTFNAGSLFNHQVPFPRLENLEIEVCKSLKYIFKPSLARDLVNLSELIINDCSKMVAVVGGGRTNTRPSKKE